MRNRLEDIADDLQPGERAVRIETFRFGVLEVEREDLIRFHEGLVGLSRLVEFVLLQDPNSNELYWLQSVARPEFALALMHASKLDGVYEPRLEQVDVDGLAVDDPSDIEMFVILNRVDGNVTANLKGPILINAGKMLGKQVVLADTRLDVRHHLETAKEPVLAHTE